MTEPSCQCNLMDTQIFNMPLSVTGVSAYIIITALLADGVKPSLDALRPRWNAAPEALDQALAELRGFNIVERHPGADRQPVYLPNPASLWTPDRQDPDGRLQQFSR